MAQEDINSAEKAEEGQANKKPTFSDLPPDVQKLTIKTIIIFFAVIFALIGCSKSFRAWVKIPFEKTRILEEAAQISEKYNLENPDIYISKDLQSWWSTDIRFSTKKYYKHYYELSVVARPPKGMTNKEIAKLCVELKKLNFDVPWIKKSPYFLRIRLCLSGKEYNTTSEDYLYCYYFDTKSHKLVYKDWYLGEGEDPYAYLDEPETTTKKKTTKSYTYGNYGGYYGGYNSSDDDDDDPYNAADYVDAEDFYYDHYDDFYDFEDAEDYYDEYGW